MKKMIPWLALCAALITTPATAARPGAGSEGDRPPGPPSEAVEACLDVDEGGECAFEMPRHEIRGTCRAVPEGQVACVPRHVPPHRRGSHDSPE